MTKEKEKYFKKAKESGFHWSIWFYQEAKEEGYKFAFRFHGHYKKELYKLMKKEEVLELKEVRKWQDDELMKRGFDRFEFVDYTTYGEQLLKVKLKNGEKWVIGYFIDLNEFESPINEKKEKGKDKE